MDTPSAEDWYHTILNLIKSRENEENTNAIKKHIESNKQYVNYNYGGLFSVVVTRNRMDLLRLLFQMGADPNLDGGEALIDAANDDNIEAVKLFIMYGASLESLHYPLLKAIKLNHFELVPLLLNAGAWHKDALRAAVYQHDKRSIKILLDQGVYSYDDINDALINLIGNQDIVSFVLQYGLDPSHSNYKGVKLAYEKLYVRTTQVLITNIPSWNDPSILSNTTSSKEMNKLVDIYQNY